MFKKAPLFFSIYVAALLVTLFGMAGRNHAYAVYRYTPRTTPAMTLFFLGLHDKVLPFSSAGTEGVVTEGLQEATEVTPFVQPQPATEIDFADAEGDAFAGETPPPVAVEEAGGLTLPPFLPENGALQPVNNVNDLVAEETWDEATRNKYSRIALLSDPADNVSPTRYFALLPSYSSGFVTVDATYFHDALFIGDSRTVGLSMYVPELNAQAVFYAKTSMTAAHVLEQPFVETALGVQTIPQALAGQNFKKIYVCLGVNELGNGTTESFVRSFAELIARLKQLQPDAILYINSIMHVSEAKDDEGGYVNNTIINDRNNALSQLADNETVFYVDMNEATDNAAGVLDDALTFDGVHLKAVSYDLWYRFLCEHAIEKE